MSNNPNIENKQVNGIDVIYFTFQGKFTDANAREGISQWKNHITNQCRLVKLLS